MMENHVASASSQANDDGVDCLLDSDHDHDDESLNADTAISTQKLEKMQSKVAIGLMMVFVGLVIPIVMDEWFMKSIGLGAANVTNADTVSILVNALYLFLLIVGLSLISQALYCCCKDKQPLIVDLLFVLFPPFEYSWKNLLGHGVTMSLLFLIFHIVLIIDLAHSMYGNLSHILGVSLIIIYVLSWHGKTKKFVGDILGDDVKVKLK